MSSACYEVGFVGRGRVLIVVTIMYPIFVVEVAETLQELWLRYRKI